MSKSDIILVPDLALRAKAKKVTIFNPALRTLANNMLKAMRANRGMGLAAPQVGQPQRLIVLEYEPEDKADAAIPLTILVNPTVTDASRETDWLDEGCLSIPGLELPVERPIQINALAQNLDGKRVKIRAKGLMARIIQHEIDHLDGILVPDRAAPASTRLTDLRVVFMGTPAFAVPYLSALASSRARIVGVITGTDKPTGRDQKTTQPPVKKIAELLNLPVWQFESLKDPLALEQFKALRPDVVIVVAYGKIIPSNWLAIPRLGFLNVHYSLLPALRGPSPHQNAILAGLKQTGFTIFQLDKGIDTGPILVQKRLTIKPTDTSESLLAAMIQPSIIALLAALPDFAAGLSQPRPQSGNSSQTRLLTKADGEIDWQKPVESIERQIRAMQPWPGCYTQVGDERLLVHSAHLEADKLVIDTVQPAGRPPMAFGDYLRSNQANRLTFFQRVGKVKLDI